MPCAGALSIIRAVGRIRVLDDALANQIAAGEVVERPASVVKELVENALDAGATAITVEVSEGGVRRLRIVDNGCGMSREDAVLALRRHATSKLATSEDLNEIRTLGFRGEALPSIASVSRFAVRTREPGAVGGTRVRVEGGADPVVEDAGGPQGTEVLVEDLFFNVPARRKFLKREATEASHVQEAVERLALAHPGVAFRFVRDGRAAFDLPRHDSLLDRVRGLFGEEIAAGVRPFALEGTPGLDGLVGDPRDARGTARHFFTYVNGRFVRDRVVMSAVQSACGARLERGRQPFLVLRLRVPPGAVDVNVHPAKTEVRFVDGQSIHRLVHRALHPVLEADPWRMPAGDEIPKTYALTLPEVEAPAAPAPVDVGLEAHRRRVFDVMERLASRRPGLGAGRVAAPVGRAEAPSRPGVGPHPTPSARAQEASPADREAPRAPVVAPVGPPAVLGARPEAAHVPFAGLRPLGLVGERLLVCAATDGLVAIDVPAARRRLAYDRLRRGAPSIPLASPATVTLSAEEIRRFEARRAALQAAGADVEPFGGATFAVKGLPAGVAEADAEVFLRAALRPEGPADTEGARALAADLAADAEGPLTPPSMPAFLAALAGLRHAPPRPAPFVAALTLAELERRLG